MQLVETGKNSFLRDESTEKIVSELPKTQFIRTLTVQGGDMSGAIQELARRTRRVQKGSAWQRDGRESSGLHAWVIKVNVWMRKCDKT